MTDYGQGLIWRVPPGGGPAVVWLRDARLEGSADFGTTGIALAADRRTLLVAQGSSAIGNGELNPATGKIYSVPIDPAGRPGAITDAVGERARATCPTASRSPPAAACTCRWWACRRRSPWWRPTGARSSASRARAGSGENGSPVPFDSPSSARFLGTRLIVANQSALAGDRRQPGAAGRRGGRARPAPS